MGYNHLFGLNQVSGYVVHVLVEVEANPVYPLQYVFFIAAGVYTMGNTLFVIFGSTKEQTWNREDSM